MKRYRVKVDDQVFEVEVEEVEGQATSRPAAPPPASPAERAPVAPKRPRHDVGEAGAVVAPMAGKVVDLLVQIGDPIRDGQPLLLLEAMKMETEIYAPRAGEVKAIKVRKEEAVSAGDVLVVIE